MASDSNEDPHLFADLDPAVFLSADPETVFKKLFNLLYLVDGFLKLKNKKKTAKNNRKNKITANF